MGISMASASLRIMEQVGTWENYIYHPKIFKPSTTACLGKVSMHSNCL